MKPQTPHVEDGTIYVTTQNGVMAVSAASGDVVWKTEEITDRGIIRVTDLVMLPSGPTYVDPDAGYRVVSSLTVGSTPLPAVTGDSLFGVSRNGGLFRKLNLSSETQDWSLPANDGTGRPIVTAGDVVLRAVPGRGTESSSLTAVGFDVGKEQWRVERERVVSLGAPAVGEGSVYTVTIGSLLSFNLGTGREEWVADLEHSPPENGVVLGDEYVYTGFEIFAADTGTRVWQAEQSPSESVSALALTESVLFVGTTDGSVYALVES